MAALAGAASVEEPVVKAMNNYLGIGIDAKVALEFHRLRDQYPRCCSRPRHENPQLCCQTSPMFH